MPGSVVAAVWAAGGVVWARRVGIERQKKRAGLREERIGVR
jgi:hypothetical protein